MTSHPIRLCDTLGTVVNEFGVVTILHDRIGAVAVVSMEDMERYIVAYNDWRQRVAPLKAADVGFMIQNLAGEGLLELGAMVLGETGYTLRLRMRRWRNVHYTVKNYADWYTAQNDAQLEAIRRS